MRKLASFDDPALAQRVRDVLHGEHIPTEARRTDEGQHAVWIVVEEDLDRARAFLHDFLADPNALRYAPALRAGQAKRVVVTRMAERRTPPRAELRRALSSGARRTPVTLALLVICGAVAVVTQLGQRTERVQWLTAAVFRRTAKSVSWNVGVDLWRHGQLWRVWTPSFLHFGIFHLLFNAWCLLEYGVRSERVQGSARFAGLVAWSAAISNITQVYFAGPNFGGMSGVVYAFVGYHWIRQRLSPDAEPVLRRDELAFFGIWLLLGFTGALDGLVGAMANYCHLAGVAAGALYAYAGSLTPAPVRRSRP